MGSYGAIENQDPVIILFDGVCNLCNGLVQFILKRDPAAKFKFASLQSDFGRSQLVRFNMNPDLLHSIVVIEENRAFERSSAVLRIARHLGGPWKIFMVFKIIPKVARDTLYNLIASNRYSIFGKARHCMIPSPNVKKHFIE